MKKIIIIMCYLIAMINIKAEDVNKEYEIKVSENNDNANLSNILIIDKADKQQRVIAEFIITKSVKVKQFLVDDLNQYLLLHSRSFFFTGKLRLLQFSKEIIGIKRIRVFDDEDLKEVYPPDRYDNYSYEQVNNRIYLKVYRVIIEDIFPYTKFVFDNCAEIWIPINDNNEEIYEDARSAIERWSYDGKLKRWSPKTENGKIDKDIWSEQIPTTELRNYPRELMRKRHKGEEVNYPEEYKKKFSEERERLRLEEEKRIAEEKQKLQQKIFIVLGILFLVTFGGFMIKKRKKKRMKLKVKL